MNRRIAPQPHTQLFGGARHYVLQWGGGGGRCAVSAGNTPAQRKTPLTPPPPKLPFFKFGSGGVSSMISDFRESPPPCQGGGHEAPGLGGQMCAQIRRHEPAAGGRGRAPKRDDKLVTSEASTSPSGGDLSAKAGARRRASEAPAAGPRGHQLAVRPFACPRPRTGTLGDGRGAG